MASSFRKKVIVAGVGIANLLFLLVALWRLARSESRIAAGGEKT